MDNSQYTRDLQGRSAEKKSTENGDKVKISLQHEEKGAGQAAPQAPGNLPLQQIQGDEIAGSTSKKVQEQKKAMPQKKFDYKSEKIDLEGIEPEMKRTMNYFENDPEQIKKKQSFELQTKKPEIASNPLPKRETKAEISISTAKAPVEKANNGSEANDRKIEKSRRLKTALLYGGIGMVAILLLAGGLFGMEMHETYLKRVPLEEILRGDVNVVLKVNADADFPQYKLLDEHMQKFPGYALLAKELDQTGEGKTPSEFIQGKLAENNLSFQQDIQAVVGGEVYVLIPDLKTIEQSVQRRFSMLKENSILSFNEGLQRKRETAGIAALTSGENEDGSMVLGLTTDYYATKQDLPKIEPLDFIMGSPIKDLKEAKRVLDKISSDRENYQVKTIKHLGYDYYQVENVNFDRTDEQFVDISTSYHCLLGHNWIMATNEQDIKDMIEHRKSSHILSVLKGPLQKSKSSMPLLAQNSRYRGVTEEITMEGNDNLISVYFKVNFKKFFEMPKDYQEEHEIPQYFKYPEDLVGGIVLRVDEQGLLMRSLSNQMSLGDVANEPFTKGLVERIPMNADSRYTDVVVENENVKDMYYSFKRENLTQDGLEEWNNVIEEVKSAIGVDLERDVVDQIAGNVAFALFAKRDLEPEMAFFVEVNDKERVIDSARKLVEMVKTSYVGILSMGSGMYMMGGQYDENGIYIPPSDELMAQQQEQANAAMEKVMNSQLTETQTELGTIYSYKLPDTIFSFDFAFSDNVLILGSHYGAVASLLDEFKNNTSPKIAAGESFQKSAKKVFPSGYSKMYMNTLGVWNSVEYYLKTYLPTDSQEEKDSIFAVGALFRTIHEMVGVEAQSGDGKSIKSSLFMGIEEIPEAEKSRAEKIIDLNW